MGGGIWDVPVPPDPPEPPEPEPVVGLATGTADVTVVGTGAPPADGVTVCTNVVRVVKVVGGAAVGDAGGSDEREGIWKGAEAEEEALTGVVVGVLPAADVDETPGVEVGAAVDVEDEEEAPMTAGTTLMPSVLLNWLILPPLEVMLLALPEVSLYAYEVPVL